MKQQPNYSYPRVEQGTPEKPGLAIRRELSSSCKSSKIQYSVTQKMDLLMNSQSRFDREKVKERSVFNINSLLESPGIRSQLNRSLDRGEIQESIVKEEEGSLMKKLRINVIKKLSTRLQKSFGLPMNKANDLSRVMESRTFQIYPKLGEVRKYLNLIKSFVRKIAVILCKNRKERFQNLS